MTNDLLSPTHRASGFLCTLIPRSRRRIAGGTVVDVRCCDPRTPLSMWTETTSNIEAIHPLAPGVTP